MSWYSANRPQAATWFPACHLSRPDKSSCWKSSSFLLSTIILVCWIPLSHLIFLESWVAISTGGTAFAATTWATLMPLAIVIGRAIRFITTTATHLLPRNHFSVHVHYTLAVRQVGSITPFQGLSHYMYFVSQEKDVCSAMYYFGQKSIHLFPLCHFYHPIQVSQIHCLVCRSFPLNRKSCSLTSQQSGYPWSIQRNQQLIILPSSIILMIWLIVGVPRVTSTQDPKPVQSGMTRAIWFSL